MPKSGLGWHLGWHAAVLCAEPTPTVGLSVWHKQAGTRRTGRPRACRWGSEGNGDVRTHCGPARTRRSWFIGIAATRHDAHRFLLRGLSAGSQVAGRGLNAQLALRVPLLHVPGPFLGMVAGTAGRWFQRGVAFGWLRKKVLLLGRGRRPSLARAESLGSQAHLHCNLNGLALHVDCPPGAQAGGGARAFMPRWCVLMPPSLVYCITPESPCEIRGLCPCATLSATLSATGRRATRRRTESGRSGHPPRSRWCGLPVFVPFDVLGGATHAMHFCTCAWCHLRGGTTGHVDLRTVSKVAKVDERTVQLTTSERVWLFRAGTAADCDRPGP